MTLKNMTKEILEQNVMVAWFRDLSVDDLANFFFLTVSSQKRLVRTKVTCQKQMNVFNVFLICKLICM